MIVFTHYDTYKDGKTPCEIITEKFVHVERGESEKYYIRWRENSPYAIIPNEHIDRFPAITLPCPSCNTEIHQQERVECECGLQMEAISENNKRKYIEACFGIDNDVENVTRLLFKTHDDKVVDGGQYDEAFYVVVIYNLNELYWLEIKSGK